MRCSACNVNILHRPSVRVELSGVDLWVVQYLCVDCARKLARALVPRRDRIDLSTDGALGHGVDERPPVRRTGLH